MLKNSGLPWFEFIVNDWLTSDDVMEMSMAERGVYITLLANQWRWDNELPAEAKKIAVICGTDARTISNWFNKWGRLFPVVHTEGCECASSTAEEQKLQRCGVGVPSAPALCTKRANPKLSKIRQSKDLQRLKRPRQDKTKEEKTKEEENNRTSAADFLPTEAVAAEDSSSLSHLFVNMVEMDNRIQSVVSAWNELSFVSKYASPEEKTPTYSHLLAFVQKDDWQDCLRQLINAYKNSSFLQRGGTSGTLNSLTWLFNKEWAYHVEEIKAGKYNNKKDSKQEEYKAKNSFFTDSSSGAPNGDLADAGFKIL